MKQQLIVESTAASFDARINALLNNGWYYVPDTFRALMSADGSQERYTMLLIQDEDHDEIVATVKSQMALSGCMCGHGDAHIGGVPPPYNQCPNSEPQSPECNPGA